MHVKGIAFIAREAMLARAHGEEKFRSFLSAHATQNTFFKQKISAISQIPAETFLTFNDAVLAEFYGGNQQAYWDFGVGSGDYALRDGPFKGMFRPGEYRKFLGLTPAIWKGYFDGGELKVSSTPEYVEVTISGVETKHVYFEYSVIGFAVGGLRLLGMAKEYAPERVKGFSAGDDVIVYRFRGI